MASIRYNWSGLSQQFKPATERVLNTIFADPFLKSQVDFKVTGTLHIRFGNLGAAGPYGTAESLDTANPIITFNTARPLGFIDGHVYFNPGSFDQKAFAANAVHEVLHVGYPKLTGSGIFHGPLPTAPPTDLQKAQDAAGEYAFRLMSTYNSQRLFGITSPDEAEKLALVRSELNANPFTKPEVSGMNWNIFEGNIMPSVLGIPTAPYRAFLPPAVETQTTTAAELWMVHGRSSGFFQMDRGKLRRSTRTTRMHGPNKSPAVG